MATTAAASAPMPPTMMNGLAHAPSSSASASAPTITPATLTSTPAASLISSTTTTVASSNAPIANSPFQSAPSSSTTTVKQSSSSAASSSYTHGNTNNIANNTRIDPLTTSLPSSVNGALPVHHDTTSIIGKRKRADSSPVKESQNTTAVSPAQRQQLLADIRNTVLTSLAHLDAGISLLDKPVSPEPSSHEAKKVKSPNPDGLQTLRQRLLSDSFYQSLDALSQDVNRVTNEALEALGVRTDIAPEDEMMDDDVHVKNEAEDTPGKIKKFRQAAQTVIAQTLTHHPYLNIPDDQKSPDATTNTAVIPDDISLDQPSPKFKYAIIVKNGNKTYYQILKKHPETNTPRRSQDEMDVDEELDELQQSDLPPQAEIVRIYENTPRETTRTLRDAFPNIAKIPTSRQDKKPSDRKYQDKGIETPDWLDYGPFMSFAPTYDQGRSTMSVHAKNQYWFALHGEKELKRIRAGRQPEQDAQDEEYQFKDLAEKYEPIPIDPALFEEESENDKTLRAISDLLAELRLKQETRFAKHSNPNVPSKPDGPETEIHGKAIEQLAELIGKLEPGTCDALEELIDSLPESLPIRLHPAPGTLLDTAKVPPPPTPQPAAPYTTTRVSYHQQDAVFSPSARVVPNRSQGHNQYTNRTGSFSQQSYPQTPINRQPYGPNAGFYPPQPAYTQPRGPPIPTTPQQYPAGGYTNSPFSRNATATVPRMASSGAHPGFVQQSNPSTPFQAIRQTSFITQGNGPAQVQTGRRVSLAPQQPQPQVRPASGQGQAYSPYTPGHNQHTFTAHQTQQQILRVQQQTQQQPAQYTPGHQPQPQQQQQQQQFAYSQQVRQMQPSQQRAPYPNGSYPQTPQVRVIQTQPGQPPTPR
ncbi:hypothetical protein TWF594_010412 [Orbilia oligospora]|nr:hypothetical protein TWF103_010691 [Orbilia oligospora]KAF3130353.1 hypothetical protein TWF594_010412 [Orbilia oligospora]